MHPDANKRPAIFFDVDSVLNEEPGPRGALKPDDVVLIPGAGAAVADAHASGFVTVAITNRAQAAGGLSDNLQGHLSADWNEFAELHFQRRNRSPHPSNFNEDVQGPSSHVNPVDDAEAGLSAAGRNRVHMYWIDVAGTVGESLLIGVLESPKRYGCFTHGLRARRY
jgi:hypothetical protein